MINSMNSDDFKSLRKGDKITKFNSSDGSIDIYEYIQTRDVEAMNPFQNLHVISNAVFQIEVINADNISQNKKTSEWYLGDAETLGAQFMYDLKRNWIERKYNADVSRLNKYYKFSDIVTK